jgi:UDP:flavonoid glycosyltransferase YjiC (YdhE family)
VSEESSTVVFFPEGAFGPTNNCVGIGDVLRQRGRRVVFIVEESFAGTLEAQGFEERLMRLTPPPQTEEAPGQFWKDFIRDTAPVFRTSTRQQLADFIAPTFQALIDGAMYVDERLREIVDELRPDLIVEDNVVAFPALPACGRPWARIMSCNPTEMKDPEVPPPFSGLPSDDTGGWDEYWHAYRDAHREMHAAFSEFCQERGAPPLPADDFIHESPWLNMYLYPDEVDYRRAQPLGPTWHNLQTSVRATDPAWELPEDLGDDEQPLLYLSLGSLGSADVELMEKLVAELAGTLNFGKPMVVLPIFWDQHDNGQRIEETGFGVRLDTYGHTGEELTAAIEQLLGDDELAGRLARASARLQSAPGTEKAADLIEQVMGSHP